MLEPKFIFGYAHKKSVGSIYSFRQFSKALDFLYLLTKYKHSPRQA